VKIAYVITRADSVGGASVHIRDLASALKDQNKRVHVFLGGGGPVADQLAEAGVPFTSLRHLQRAVNPITDFRAYLELKSVLRKYAPDLVSAHTAKAGFIGRAAAKALGIPCIYTPHGWTIGDRISARQGAVYAYAERLAAPWSAAIVCVSEAERQLALQKQIASPNRLHVIHNGVRDIGSDLRAAPSVEPVRIACIARFESPKDHRTLLEAVAQLHAFEWTLELIGDGPLESEIRTHAAELGVRYGLEFSGYVRDPAVSLSRAQIFVLSSRSEGFPRSVLEAMRAGLPVVASDVGGVREMSAVKLVPPGSAHAMAQALKELIIHPDARLQLGAAAREAYERNFRFETMLDRTEELYCRVLEGSPVTS
jgi:glycosyltransferase involved in cell wall biosynthesis